MVRVLGIDPGTKDIGYAVLDDDGNAFTPVRIGAWRLPATRPDTAILRLPALVPLLRRLILETLPDEMALENGYIGVNPETALAIGMARGVVLAVAAHHNLTVRLYQPTVVKRAVTSRGNADKQQVWDAARALLGQPKGSELWTADASDAVAVAIAHLNQRNETSILERARP